MASEIEYRKRIRSYGRIGLRRLWCKKQRNEVDNEFWARGKLLEYIILRAFELEGAEVTYPYSVRLMDETVEQIDGAIKVESMYSLIECKDQLDAINVEPLAKLRNQLARRHASVFGMFFSMSNYTAPAELLVQFMAPQMIILWGEDDIDYCFRHRCFIECFTAKYKVAIENCEYNFHYSLGNQLQ